MKVKQEDLTPTIHTRKAHLMIFSMKIDDMVSRLTRLLGGLRIGHSLMGNSAAYYTVRVVPGIRCMKIDLLTRVTDRSSVSLELLSCDAFDIICSFILSAY